MEYDPTNPTDDGPPKTASPTLTQPPTANAGDSTTAAYQYDYSYYYNYYTQNQQNGTTASYPQTTTLDPQQQQQYQMQYAAYYAQAQVNPAAFANTSYYPYYPQVSYAQPPYGVCAPRTQTANQKPKRNNNNNNNNNSNNGNSNKESLKRKRQDDEATAILKKFKVKIPSDESPEEIAKWIEERRKKFPTRENVEKRRAEILERNEQRRQMREKKNQTQGDQTATSTDPHTEEDGRDGDVSNSAENYESTSNHRDRRDKNKRKRRICSYFLKGKCKQGVNCKYLHEHPNPKPIAPPKRPPSLLTKLLDDTLQQEAQILLQCLVYINENNFFLDYSSDGEEDEVEEEDEEEESSESSSEDSSDSEESDDSNIENQDDDSNIENQKKDDVEEGELLEESFDQK